MLLVQPSPLTHPHLYSLCCTGSARSSSGVSLLGRGGSEVARRISSRARLKFWCRSSISHHSHHTWARSSMYLKGDCGGVGEEGT